MVKETCSSKVRFEQDEIGSVELDSNCLYGISTVRAKQNFYVNDQTVSKEFIHELINIKKQAAIINKELGFLDNIKSKAIVTACNKLLSGKHQDMFIVPLHQGGAGTSTNMNVNEVIANLALLELNKKPGTYSYIHPINDINKHQSTNDVYPTAIKIALIKKIRECAIKYQEIQSTCQEKETEFDNIIKLGRTQYQDAVPLRVGQQFQAYAEVFSRDRWRIYKAEERMRVVNIGGTAIGTGLNAPVKYTFLMTEYLRTSTNTGISRAENLIDNTQNLDAFLEVSGLLKTAASSLIKIANDLRFLSSGPNGGINEIILDKQQIGSSIMPGKVNPVILEMVIMNSYKIQSNDTLISNLVSNGSLELNPFLPMISETLLDSLNILIKTTEIFNNKCLKGIKVNKEQCLKNVLNSSAIITPLINIIGYDKASEIVKESIKSNKTIKQLLLEQDLFTNEELENILNPYNITKPGIIKR